MQKEGFEASEDNTILHVVSLSEELQDADEYPDYEMQDMVVGLSAGIDSVELMAFQLRKECWLIDPGTGSVIFRFNPKQVVIH
ncbi:hypothetical protein LC612_31700 [Nostoc sp. CHAB 5834]|nr:hypothetical protein [Nostoc sp. CHAB 5834]